MVVSVLMALLSLDSSEAVCEFRQKASMWCKRVAVFQLCI